MMYIDESPWWISWLLWGAIGYVGAWISLQVDKLSFLPSWGVGLILGIPITIAGWNVIDLPLYAFALMLLWFPFIYFEVPKFLLYALRKT